MCPYPWTEYRGRCYQHFSSMMEWVSADFHCEVLGAHLVSVHSAEEDFFLKDQWID